MDKNIVNITVNLPRWVSEIVEDKAFNSSKEKMELCLSLLERHVEDGSGGPFAAIIFDSKTNKPLTVGLNLVVPGASSLLHAEVVAIIQAQQLIKSWNLSEGGRELTLVTSAEPCIQCFGAIWWSGLMELVYGATAEDVEKIVGFSEGPVPKNWQELLEKREVGTQTKVIGPVCRSEACVSLKRYRELGKPVYTPGL